jgi:agmatinase
VFGDTPSFLGVPVLPQHDISAGYDVIVSGVPWEGTVTWGSYSGCELSPRTVRHAAARYGGFLPEYEIDIFDYLRVGDIGDIPVNPMDAQSTMRSVYQAMSHIYQRASVPFTLGGDHSFTPETVRALADNSEGEIGIIHFDAHLDNSPGFGEDGLPRCSPIYRIAQIPKVKATSIAQVGVRGPRNSPAQWAIAKNMGAHVFTIRDIQTRGMDAVMEDVLRIAHAGTKHVFVTICSDCIDAGFNPGGPADFNGLTPRELLPWLFRVGEAGIAGADHVEVYPNQDPHGFSSHLAAWALIYLLAGMASRKKSQSR